MPFINSYGSLHHPILQVVRASSDSVVSLNTNTWGSNPVGTVNITFLTSLVSQKYTGFQYALLTSVMTFTGTIFKGFSGVIVESFQSLYGFNYGWMSFYIFTSCLALPAILLIISKKGFFVNSD